MPKLRVAICGGGIGGLCFAVALSRYSDIEVSVYEAAGQFKEIGAGVMIWERTWNILTSLGLSNQLSEIADGSMDGSLGVGFEFRRSDMASEGFQFCLFETPYGCIRFHRAHFLDVFINNLPSGVAHFGKRLLNYVDQPQNPEILLNFADGTKATCDLLVGCDGVKSIVRKQMFETLALEGQQHLLQYIEPKFSGIFAYRGLIPIERLRKEAGGTNHRTIHRAMMYCGPSKHVVTYGIGRGSIVNVNAMVYHPELEGKDYIGPWVQESTQEEFQECYSGWEPEVDQLIRSVEKPMLWAVHALNPLPNYVAGRVALLGDAAHAMTPHQGAGAGQAIEDAYILASILGHALTTKTTLSQALAAYEHIRLPLANHVLRESRNSGLMYEFNSEYRDNYDTLGPAIQAQWDWLGQTSPQDEVNRGLQYMKELCNIDDTAGN